LIQFLGIGGTEEEVSQGAANLDITLAVLELQLRDPLGLRLSDLRDPNVLQGLIKFR